MEVHQSGGWDYPGLDLAWVFEEVLKVGVLTKFSPKLPQASSANGWKITEKLQIQKKKKIMGSFSELEKEKEELCVCLCAAGPPHTV